METYVFAYTPLFSSLLSPYVCSWLNIKYRMQGAKEEESREEICLHKLDERSERNSHLLSPQTRPESVAYDEQRWQTVTHDSYPAPRSDVSRSLGRRRELVKNFIGLRVFDETMNAIVAEPPPQPISPSEYAANFCDSEFIPFMDRTEYDTRKHIKYPLYGGGAAQSYYKSQLDRGTLKARSEISDFNQPFRRSCSFTTPLDLTLREPTGGF